MSEEEKLYIVRLYDGFDNEWMDVSKPVTYKEAEDIWGEKTENGTKETKFEDIAYYKIFPANTVMHFSLEGEMQRKCGEEDD